MAPAAICMCAMGGALWVLACGRMATPAPRPNAAMRSMLRDSASYSISSAGVSIAEAGPPIAATPTSSMSCPDPLIDRPGAAAAGASSVR